MVRPVLNKQVGGQGWPFSQQQQQGGKFYIYCVWFVRVCVSLLVISWCISDDDNGGYIIT